MPDESFAPLLRQYLGFKNKYKEAVLFFRLGDFYELFFEDAKECAPILGITLTSRELQKGNKVPMCGVPSHMLHAYIPKLLRAGKKVAICEQIEPPGKNLIRREVTRILTPGTVLEGEYLDSTNETALMAIAEGDNDTMGYAVVRLGSMQVLLWPEDRLSVEQLAEQLQRFGISEIVLPEGSALYDPLCKLSQGIPVEIFDTGGRDLNYYVREFLAIANSVTLESFGGSKLYIGAAAAGLLFSYLRSNLLDPSMISWEIQAVNDSKFVPLDTSTRRALALFRQDLISEEELSLETLLDHTCTPMGKRLLRQWMMQPLRVETELLRRWHAVEELISSEVLDSLREKLGSIADIMRITSRCTQGLSNPRELRQLGESILQVPSLVEFCSRFTSDLLRLNAQSEKIVELGNTLRAAIVDNPPVRASDGGYIKSGYDQQLDEIRDAGRKAKEELEVLEQRERTRTGIKNLKVGYNRVFGYFIELSKAADASRPSEYILRQTLANANRYITAELKELEATVVGQHEKELKRELELYADLVSKVKSLQVELKNLAHNIATVDVLQSFATAANKYSWSEPELVASKTIEIQDGRHPLVEVSLPFHDFVPNDTLLGEGGPLIMVITGPNMAGKSTYLRQVATIIYLAQIGSFVPASVLKFGLVDRIFCRIGARDELSRGMSTFMLEMVESANILHNATPDSLVILDEVGRGTSTFDGLAIAQAMVEYLHENPRKRCRTLFATHYHELTTLADRLEDVANFTMAVEEKGNSVRFLYKVIPGAAQKSYGIHVARNAGIPGSVLARAEQLLHEMEERHGTQQNTSKAEQLQLSLYPDIASRILELDLENMTPIEALVKLHEIRKELL